MLLREDAIRVQHMVDAARQARLFIVGRQRPDLESDTMLLFAVVRAIEIVGEAAGHVSAEGRSAIPEIPWPQVVGCGTASSTPTSR